MAGARDGQDAKLVKLAEKIEKKPELGGGHDVLVAVPVKRGGLAAATAGALSGSTRRVLAAQERSRGGVDAGEAAGKLLRMIGDGSDFVLCCTADDVRVIRLVGFGVLGKATIVPRSTMTGIACDDDLGKDVALVFVDGSALTSRCRSRPIATRWPQSPRACGRRRERRPAGSSTSHQWASNCVAVVCTAPGVRAMPSWTSCWPQLSVMRTVKGPVPMPDAATK